MKYQSVTIQMQATEHYFPVVLFIMLFKMVLIKALSVTIQIKATERYYRILLLFSQCCRKWNLGGCFFFFGIYRN